MTVQLGIDGCGPMHNPDLSQWFTPPNLAENLVNWALCCSEHRRTAPHTNWRVLEPAAGNGSFVAPMADRFRHVTAYEIDPGWAEVLQEKHPKARVVTSDYLAAPPPDHPYDLAVMNPPYEDGADGRFVAKAMDESVRVLALVRLNFLAGADRFDRVWKQIGTRRDPGPWSLDGVVYFVHRPRFSGAGSPKHDFCAVYLTRDDHERMGACCPDWWEAAE